MPETVYKIEHTISRRKTEVYDVDEMWDFH